MSHVYLASPYTHEDKEVMKQRYLKTMKYILESFEKEPYHTIYSPIVYYHQFAERFELPRDAEFWRIRNEDMIASCKELRVLKLPGWELSQGINELEIPYAREIKKPIVFVEV